MPLSSSFFTSLVSSPLVGPIPMESDDDLELFNTPRQPSPPSHTRKLKRLKKSLKANSIISPQLTNLESSSPPDLDFTPPESSPKLPDSDDLSPENLDESNEPLQLRPRNEGLGNEEELSSGFEGLGAKSTFDDSNPQNLDESIEPLQLSPRSEGLGAKRALAFDTADAEFAENDDVRDGEQSEESKGVEEEEEEWSRFEESEEKSEGRKEKKNKKAKTDDDGFDAIPMRMTQKERRGRMEELRAESQRLLRESGNAGFKPVPLVQKPISSVLEKIRKRKLEVLKKSVSSNSKPRELTIDVDSDPEDLIDVETSVMVTKVVSKETVIEHVEEKNGSDELGNDGLDGTKANLGNENMSSHMALNEENKQEFRAPIDDTQDLFPDLPTSDTNTIGEPSNEQPSSPLEEQFAPSVLAMNLELDSAPPDEHSDEEDNDKENISPRLHVQDDLSSSPRGDPVKAFVDEEAEEEDDSDNDLQRFDENEEDDDSEDVEEMNSMIATDYKERPVDAEMRNELHQKWLEQQDAAGTEDLFQRLKYGSILKETGLIDEEEDEDEGEDRDSEHDTADDALEGKAPSNIVRMNMRKAKQMLSQMFTDKDDMYISSDDEETEKKLVTQRLTEKEEERASLVPPDEDENSREVFGRIKKLNVLPDTKKKPRASAFLDTLLTRGNNNSSSKSSFLGRAANSSLPSFKKRGSSKSRSFIFERDESNNRNAMPISEDPSDAIQKETQQKRKSASKVSYSQPKSSSQAPTATTEKETRTSLFEILRRSSERSDSCSTGTIAHDTRSIFMAFKLDKSIKNEGRG